MPTYIQIYMQTEIYATLAWVSLFTQRDLPSSIASVCTKEGQLPLWLKVCIVFTPTCSRRRLYDDSLLSYMWYRDCSGDVTVLCLGRQEMGKVLLL